MGSGDMAGVAATLHRRTWGSGRLARRRRRTDLGTTACRNIPDADCHNLFRHPTLLVTDSHPIATVPSGGNAGLGLHSEPLPDGAATGLLPDDASRRVRGDLAIPEADAWR